MPTVEARELLLLQCAMHDKCNARSSDWCTFSAADFFRQHDSSRKGVGRRDAERRRKERGPDTVRFAGKVILETVTIINRQESMESE